MNPTMGGNVSSASIDADQQGCERYGLPSRPARQGKPVVLFHGLGSTWRSWQPILDDIAAERTVRCAGPTRCR